MATAQPLLMQRRDFGDGLQWWDMAFAAGYPDWLIRSHLPPDDEKDDEERWVWTGRIFAPVPRALYSTWLRAHHEPIAVPRLVELLRPLAEAGERPRDLLRIVLDAGLFVTWPWAHLALTDAPEAYSLVPNPVSLVSNPLPRIIPENLWPGCIRLDHLARLWSDAHQREAVADGLFDTVQILLRNRMVWLVANPVAP